MKAHNSQAYMPGRKVLTFEHTRLLQQTPQSPAGRVKLGNTLKSKYKVGPWIGGGGMGVIFEGTDIKTNEKVAIKAFRQDKNRLADFDYAKNLVQEFEILKDLEGHPSIASPRELVFDENGPFLVLDFIEGYSLPKIIDKLVWQNIDTPSFPRLIDCFLSITYGLAHVHEKGYLMLDVNPGNLMLSYSVPGILIDFGISAQYHYENCLGGNLLSISPEQRKNCGKNPNPLTPATDIFALGTCLARMNNTYRNCDAAYSPQATPELKGLIDHMMKKAPERRITTLSLIEGFKEISRIWKTLKFLLEFNDIYIEGTITMTVQGIKNSLNKPKTIKDAFKQALKEDPIVKKLPPTHKKALASVLQSQLSQLLS